MFDENTMIMLYAASGCIAVGLFAYFLFPRSIVTLDQDLQEVEAGRGGVLRLATPFLKSLSDITVSWRGKRMDAYRGWLDGRIVMAGLENKITTEEFVAMHLLDGILGLGLGAFAGWCFSWKAMLVVAAILGIVGLWFPYGWIGGLVKKRHKEVFRALPYTLDLLTVSVESGLDFLGGLQRVGRPHDA